VSNGEIFFCLAAAAVSLYGLAELIVRVRAKHEAESARRKPMCQRALEPAGLTESNPGR
jgi:hypothetical protein